MSETRSLSSVLNAPRQTATRVYSQAFDAISTAPAGALKYKRWGDAHYVLSPSVTFTVTNEVNGKAATHEFAVTAIVPDKETPVKLGVQISLIASGNVNLPIAYINESATNYPYYSPEDDKPIDTSEVDLILDKIYDRVNELIKEEEQEKERQQDRERQANRDRRDRWLRRLRNTGVTFMGAGVVAGGIYSAYQWNASDNKKQEQQRAAEQAEVDAKNQARWDAIAAFDGKGIVIKSDLVLPGKQSDARLDREAMALLEDAPQFEDLLDNPRRLDIRAGDIREIATVPPGKGVRVTTNAPEDHVVVNVLENGAVWLIALPESSQGSDDIPPSYDVLIQSSNTAG